MIMSGRNASPYCSAMRISVGSARGAPSPMRRLRTRICSRTIQRGYLDRPPVQLRVAKDYGVPPPCALHTPLSHSRPVAQAGVQTPGVQVVPVGQCSCSTSLWVLHAPSSHSWPLAQTGVQVRALSLCGLQTPSSHSVPVGQADGHTAACSTSTSISPSWLMLVLNS